MADTPETPTAPTDPTRPTPAGPLLEAQLSGMAPPPPVLEVPVSKKPTCPTCKTPLEVYVGENVHKLATAWCSRCGLRHKLV